MTGAEWATFFAAVAAAVRAGRVQRALAHAEERWRVAREVQRGRWGDR